MERKNVSRSGNHSYRRKKWRTASSMTLKHPTELIVTLKMEAAKSCETWDNLTTTWLRNPKEDHHFISNDC